MGEWKKIKLGDLISLIGGFSYKGKYIGEGSTILLGMGCVSFNETFLHSGARLYSGECSETHLAKPGDLVLATRQQSDNLPILGFPAIIPKEYSGNKIIVGTNLYKVINNSEVNNDFLFWLFKGPEYQNHIFACSTGTTVRMITKDAVESFEFSCPPKNERIKISRTLWQIDDKIDLLHRQNKTLEAMAETLFRQWFVEEAREDWEVGCLGDVLTAKGGTTPSTKNSEYWDGDIHWSTPKDLSDSKNIYMFATERKITEKGLSKISSGLHPVGTVLLSSRAPVGYLSITGIPVAINQGYIAILDDKGFSKYFLYLWLKNNIEYIVSNANGSTFLEISKSVFKSLKIVKPPADLRDNFDGKVSLIFQKIKTNSIQIRTLEKLRDTLLPKLMNGEVRVEYEN